LEFGRGSDWNSEVTGIRKAEVDEVGSRKAEKKAQGNVHRARSIAHRACSKEYRAERFD